MVPFDRRLPADASAERGRRRSSSALNADPAVSGILLQLPVPDHLDGPRADGELVGPDKDVDGLTPVNAGLLALGTPRAAPVHAARA